MPRPPDRMRWRRPLSLPSANRSAQPGSSWLDGYLKPILIAVVIGLASSTVGYLFGQATERARLKAQDARTAVEGRKRVYIASAQDFGIYLTQWGRLRTISPAEDNLRAEIEGLVAATKACTVSRRRKSECSIDALDSETARKKEELKRVEERKERYIKDRDGAKDRLSGNFEQARLFFGSQTQAAVAAFEEFEKLHGNRRIGQLPPAEEWRIRARSIFDAMKEEIKSDEARL